MTKTYSLFLFPKYNIVYFLLYYLVIYFNIRTITLYEYNLHIIQLNVPEYVQLLKLKKKIIIRDSIIRLIAIIIIRIKYFNPICINFIKKNFTYNRISTIIFLLNVCNINYSIQILEFKLTLLFLNIKQYVVVQRK